MEYPNLMTDILKSVESQKKAESFPDGINGQILKISVRNAHLSILANDQKYNRKDNREEMKKAAIELIATTFIFLKEL